MKGDSARYLRKRLAVLGFAAGFIDAAGGGGLGLIPTPAFVATSSDPRKAVGTVESTEPIIFAATVETFDLIIGFESFLWNMFLPMIIGGITLTPIAAYSCSKTPRRVLGALVGLWIAILNIRTLKMMLLQK